MIKSLRIIDKGFSKEQFNKRAFHPLQSWQWGEAREKTGIEVLRIGEFEKEKLLNVYQLTFHQILFTSFKIGYLPRSPLPSKEVLNFLADYGRKNKTIFIKIEPYVRKSEIRSTKSEEKSNITMEQFSNLSAGRQGVTISPHPLFPKWTIQLDITKPEEELLKNMKSKTRYNIRLAQKKGVYVKEMTDRAGFEIFADLYFKTTKRQKYFGHDYKYHQTVFETLKKKIAYILIAFYKNEPLGAYEIFLFKDIIYYPYGGSSEKHKNLMASNLLMWEIIKFGKDKGAKIFDMWGSLSPNYSQSDPWAGFTRFKQGYGGEFVEFVGSYDLVTNKGLYQIYNSLYKLRQIVLRARYL